MSIKNLKAFLPTILAFTLISAMNQCQSERVKRQTQTGTMTSLQEIEVNPEEAFRPVEEATIEENFPMEPVKNEVESPKIGRIP